ncbi:MAG TPA: alpha-glucan family phosphorylase [Chloroflexota bacterium]|nr:alpha-glucan family phosphorylase [Chloroflexota bacterium]
MPKTADIEVREPLTLSDGALRVRRRRDNLIPALEQVAYNLRWSWDPATRDLFQSLAPEPWARTHNPIAVLKSAASDPDRLAEHAESIIERHSDLEQYLKRAPHVGNMPRIAYFCAEFAIAESLPIYSGGLGVLAGDHLKAASDLGLPLVAVGLLYRYGYFRQVIDDTGYQREAYDRLDTDAVAVRPVLDAQGAPIVIEVPFPGRSVLARVWVAQVGRVPLYLLDTDLADNREDDRWITGHLYGGDQDTRIRQEIVLGIGGLRALRAILPAEAQPDVLHMNEGHSAFLSLELARELLASGAAQNFDEAALQVAPHLAFTTHTPVAAGHDAFPSDLVEAYFNGYRQQLGLTHEEFMERGRRDKDAAWERFSMTVLALRSASRRNGVSQLHGAVSKEMWGGVGLTMNDAPPAAEMEAITNGVHTATWIGPEMGALFDRQLGTDWRTLPEVASHWSSIAQTDRRALWAARTAQRARLLERVDAMSRHEGLGGLHPDVTADKALVLGFARRFATYKRAGLVLSDPERLVRLMDGGNRPLVIVFAGKAHPRDDPGKLLVQRIVQASRDARFRGRLVFLENYDVEIARLLVQGSDVWMNTPRRPQEASGTSGMKAALNGSLHLSELDGWWDEAYAPGMGWALGEGLPQDLLNEAHDAAEAKQLMDLLEFDILPMFFDRDEHGTPARWLSCVSNSIATMAPQFSAQRMVREYAERFYTPAGAAVSR